MEKPEAKGMIIIGGIKKNYPAGGDEDKLLRELEAFYLLFEKQGFSPIIKHWKHLSSTIGKRIKVVSRKNIAEGEAIDIDSDGALLIRKDSGFISRVISGDVLSVR